jgi:RNA polymerase sigma factor (TIGR02999 family)
MSEITKIIHAIEAGDPHAAPQLLPLVYDELRRLAAQRLAQEKPGQTLQPTALVHEAYLRLVGDRPEQNWDHRGHFFAAAAEAMRRILVDAARRKRAIRHGGGRQRVPLQDLGSVTESPDDLLALDEALSRFAIEEPAKAELVKLRFFAGLSTPDAAKALGISVASAERWWVFARAWLFSELERENGEQKFPVS